MARIISIGRTKWVVGLDWNSYEDRPDKTELKTDAERQKSDWVALRLGESSVQAGFCEPLDGIKRPHKLASLAAMVADSNEQPWIGIFKIDEGLWWYIAVRDGHAIMLDGDVIGGEEEIREAQERHAGFGDWNYIEGTKDDLAIRISDIKAKPTYVKSLTNNGPTKAQLIAATALVSMAVAGSAYWIHLKNEIKEREEAEATARVLAQLNQGSVISQAESPLINSFTPTAWIKACKETMYPIPLSYAGWRLEKVSCETLAVTAIWKLEPGATVSTRPEGFVSEDGATITQTLNLPEIDHAGVDDAMDLHDAQLVLRAWAQKNNLALTMKNVTPPMLPGGSQPVGPDGKPLPPQRPQLSVLIDSPLSPFSLDFEGLPGLRFTNISNNGADWHFEGTIYGR